MGKQIKREIFSNDIFGKGLIAKQYQEFVKLKGKNINTRLKQ